MRFVNDVINYKLHSFAFDLLVSNSSVCERSSPKKQEAAAEAGLGGDNDCGGAGRRRMARAAAGRRGRGRRRQRRRQARMDAEGQGTRAGGDDDGRRGRTLTGKGREPGDLGITRVVHV